MLTLRLARRANADVCWSVSVAVERLLAIACSHRTRSVSDAAAARIQETPAPTTCSNNTTTPQSPALRLQTVAIPKVLPELDITTMTPQPQPTPPQPATKQTFSFDDYDCIGFDLDNTICRYRVANMVRMEYAALSEYLINECNYSPKYLGLPMDDNINFMIKGLILDVKKGNILRIAPTGRILQGCHGTKELSMQELINYYGADLKWNVTQEFIHDPLCTWNGPLSETMRILSDYFDMPASLVFARAVDTLDEENGGVCKEYNIYPDIQKALTNMFQKEHFSANIGGYFPNVKNKPDEYIHKCSDKLMNWFRDLKANGKQLFLVTGSNVDFASHTASSCLGADWQQLFDIVICFAKKPGFFTQKRPFIGLNGFEEADEVHVDHLQKGGIYTAGNWDGVYKFLQRTGGKTDLKVVYIGDHLIQDVYTPAAHAQCDAIAVCEELEAEGVFGHDAEHHDGTFLTSPRWGSYFTYEEKENIWRDFLRKHAKLTIPSLEYVARYPVTYQFTNLL